MKINVRLYFKDGSHMVAFLSKKKELSHVFILKDVYKIILSKDSFIKENGAQKLREEVIDVYYIGNAVNPELIKNNKDIIKMFGEQQIKKALDNNDKFVLLRDGKSFAIASKNSKIIEPSMIVGGYIRPDVDVYEIK